MTPGGSIPASHPVPPVYSRGERIADAVLHLVGVTAALVAVPVLIAIAAVWHGSAPTIAAVSVYGAGLLSMLALSAAYHLVTRPGAKAVLRRLDHAAIYVKIASTYTPFAVLLAGAQAAVILAGIWSAALAGLALKLAVPARISARLEGLAVALYLGMGWAILVVGGPILDRISTAGLVLVLLGGGLYTLGVVFHLWRRLPFQNVIWHALVLAASFVFYAAILVETARIPAGS